MGSDKAGAPKASSKKEKNALVMMDKLMSQKKMKNSDFVFGKRIGRGQFGRVITGQQKDTGKVVAIKMLTKTDLITNGVVNQVVREIEIQSKLQHPNILQLLGWYDDSYRYYLVLEYASKGALVNTLAENIGGRLDDHLAAKYIYQVSDAVHYCHRHFVIHRDIKPENLLVTSNDDIKLADFGWAVKCQKLKRRTFCGTDEYLAPEIIRREEYGHYVDNWCIGVLCYELLTGTTPFIHKIPKVSRRKIKNVKFKYPDFMNEDAKDLISKLLIKKPSKRLSLPQVMKHPWIKKNK